MNRVERLNAMWARVAKEKADLEAQLTAAREAHAATLAELNLVRGRLRESLRANVTTKMRLESAIKDRDQYRSELAEAYRIEGALRAGDSA